MGFDSIQNVKEKSELKVKKSDHCTSRGVHMSRKKSYEVIGNLNLHDKVTGCKQLLHSL